MRGFLPLVPLALGIDLALVACVGDDPDPPSSNASADSGGGADSSGGGGDTGGGGSDTGTSSDAGTDATEIRRLVFVTSAQYPASFASASDPWTAGDTICAAEAAGSSLPGTFVAWISYENAQGTPFHAGGRIADAPYYLPGNAAEGGAPLLVVESKAELLSSGPRIPINRHPNGEVTTTDSASFTKVWTGTNASGNATGTDCAAWTATMIDGGDPTGGTGNAALYSTPAAADWTSFGNRPCANPARIYCFQK